MALSGRRRCGISDAGAGSVEAKYVDLTQMESIAEAGKRALATELRLMPSSLCSSCHQHATKVGSNASVTIANLGATIIEYTVDGLRVIPGFPNVRDYLRSDNPYCGATIGRISNRIANAKISLPLAEKASHQLSSNDAYAKKGASCLHGGPGGFHQK